MKYWRCSTVALLAMLMNAGVASAAGEGHDVVRSSNGQLIRNSWENCVVTKWQTGEGACEQEHSAKPNAINTELLNIYFTFDSAELAPSVQEKLDRVVDVLMSAKDVLSVDIIGYADYLGNPDYNRALSERRARAVRQYIESKGYHHTRNVSVMALGEHASVTHCEDTNNTELKDCLWRDRRVEIKLNYER
jgi:outer membrane protein OmpA-like peptidoglycan-associated protein